MRCSASLSQSTLQKHEHNDGVADAAVVTLAADPLQFHVIDRVDYSYSSAPTAGGLTIAINGVTVLAIDITAAGPGHLDLSDTPLYDPAYTANQAVVVTLLDGGGMNHKLTVIYR